jgi:hypothetical protein
MGADIRERLKGAALEPSFDIDVDDLQERARRTHMRHKATTAAVSLVTVVAGAALVLSALGSLDPTPPLVGPGDEAADRIGTPRVPGAEDTAACDPAHAMAATYFEQPELVAAVAASVGDLRTRPGGPSVRLHGWHDDDPAWLCYFVGDGESLAKAPPPTLDGATSPPFDRLGLIVFENGEVLLWSMSYAETDPWAPPGSGR